MKFIKDVLNRKKKVRIIRQISQGFTYCCIESYFKIFRVACYTNLKYIKYELMEYFQIIQKPLLSERDYMFAVIVTVYSQALRKLI